MATTGLLNNEYLSKLIGNRVEDIVQTIFAQYSQTIDETLTNTLLNYLDGKGALTLLSEIQEIRDSCNTENDDQLW